MRFTKKVSAAALTQVCEGPCDIAQINLVTASNAITECSIYDASQYNTPSNPLTNIAPDCFVAQYGSPTGWADSSGTMLHSSGTDPLTKNLSEASGDLYCVTFTVAGRTAGSVAAAIGGVTLTTRSTNATFSEVCRATGTTDFTITPSNDFDGAVSGIIVYKLGDADDIVHSDKFATVNDSKPVDFFDSLHLSKGCMTFVAGTNGEAWIYVK